MQPGFEIAEWPCVFSEDQFLWMYNFAGTNLVAYETKKLHPNKATNNNSVRHVVAVFKLKKNK